MGIIINGILGGVDGKVAGVVGSRWKDKQYLRRYAIPANPNTTLQQAQRSKMAIGVAFLKNLTGQVFNTYVDKFQKSMSGFNYTLQQNMALFLIPIIFASVKITQGKLWPLTSYSLATLNHILTLTFDAASFGNNGAATDAVYGIAYDATDELWYFIAAEDTRGSGTAQIILPAGAVGHTVHTYWWCAKYSLTSPTLLEMVSNSIYATIVVA